MIDLSSIHNVVQRITEIETKIGVRKQNAVGVGFSQALHEEMKKQPPMTQGTSAVPNTKPTDGARTQVTPNVITTPSINSGAYSGQRPVHTQSHHGKNNADPFYAEVVQAAAKKYHVDPRLVSAVAEMESGFNQDAVSNVGAVGIMQLMPETAAALGVNPYNAEQNIEGGARYLRELLDTFGGDVRNAVAAYNAGPQAVKAYGGVPPYSETQQYVDSVLDLYR